MCSAQEELEMDRWSGALLQPLLRSGCVLELCTCTCARPVPNTTLAEGWCQSGHLDSHRRERSVSSSLGWSFADVTVLYVKNKVSSFRRRQHLWGVCCTPRPQRATLQVQIPNWSQISRGSSSGSILKDSFRLSPSCCVLMDLLSERGSSHKCQLDLWQLRLITEEKMPTHKTHKRQKNAKKNQC